MLKKHKEKLDVSHPALLTVSLVLLSTKDKMLILFFIKQQAYYCLL